MHIALKTVVAVLASVPLCAWALLEDNIIAFEASKSYLDITRSDILISSEDSVGIHIAAQNLANDLKQVTGVIRSLEKLNGINSVQAHSATAIIAGSLNSTLIKHLSSKGLLDVSDLQGKWESFVTSVVDNALPGVRRAFVIAGSDTRGTIFGIYTLSGQAGQSPYVSLLFSSCSFRPSIFFRG